MTNQARARLQYLVDTYDITPQRDEPLSHFEAKCKIIEIAQAQGLKAYPEHCWGEHYFEDKGWRTYTSDILIEDPVLEARKFIVEINGAYHFSDYSIKHKKTENRKKDIEEMTKLPLIPFAVEEVVGKFHMDDRQIRERMGLDTF